MIKYIIPIILIGISIALFFGFTDVLYQDISSMKELSSSYNEALGNSKALEAERDKLTAKYNTINPADIAKLEKLIPDSVDNIRLILEIEKTALPYGMTLKDVKYDTLLSATADGQTRAVETGAKATTSRLPYGIWDLEFSTEGTYSNFVNFVKDLESNLRIVDVTSIEFSSPDVVGLNPNLPQSYKYQFKIKTYWLKN